LIPYSIDWLLIKKRPLLEQSDAEMKEFIAVHLLKEVLLQYNQASIKFWMVAGRQTVLVY
jgi:hypothetical protein